MATAIIGGEAIEVSFPNFKALKEFWPYQRKMQAAGGDPEAITEAMLGIVSAGSGGKYSLDRLEEMLQPPEITALNNEFARALMVELGMAPKGEAKPAGDEASPSTATSTASSPNLSPPDAETGTA